MAVVSTRSVSHEQSAKSPKVRHYRVVVAGGRKLRLVVEENSTEQDVWAALWAQLGWAREGRSMQDYEALQGGQAVTFDARLPDGSMLVLAERGGASDDLAEPPASNDWASECFRLSVAMRQLQDENETLWRELRSLRSLRSLRRGRKEAEAEAEAEAAEEGEEKEHEEETGAADKEVREESRAPPTDYEELFQEPFDAERFEEWLDQRRWFDGSVQGVAPFGIFVDACGVTLLVKVEHLPPQCTQPGTKNPAVRVPSLGKGDQVSIRVLGHRGLDSKGHRKFVATMLPPETETAK